MRKSLWNNHFDHATPHVAELAHPLLHSSAGNHETEREDQEGATMCGAGMLMFVGTLISVVMSLDFIRPLRRISPY